MREARASSIGIVGAGVAGLTAAHALRRAGFTVTVLERAPVLRAVGGAMILWSNALATLERLGLRAGLLVRPTTQVVARGEFRDTGGELLASLPIAKLARKHGAETVVVARADLLALLAEHAGAIRFDRELCALRDTGDEVIARFGDGDEMRFALLIGADGLRSVVREALGAALVIRRAQQDIWVGTCDGGSLQLSPGVVTATVGASRRFWCTLLGDGRVFWYATLPSSEQVGDLGGLAAQYAGWHAPIATVIARTQVGDAVRTSIKDREPSSVWGAGRVTLVGDSAHAMTPDLGQGACQAIESASALADSLQMYPDPATAARDYERRRYARTADVNRLSWLVAQSSATPSQSARWLRDTAIRSGLRAAFLTQLDWLFTAS
jgi:2-polyprenyl-6-methoxyphenol hydroxylase-like FAD-dependent oxidoreductase